MNLVTYVKVIYLPFIVTQTIQSSDDQLGSENKSLPRSQQNRQRWAQLPDVPRFGSEGFDLPPIVNNQQQVGQHHHHPQCPRCSPGGHHPHPVGDHWTEEQWNWWNWWMQWYYFQMMHGREESEEEPDPPPPFVPQPPPIPPPPPPPAPCGDPKWVLDHSTGKCWLFLGHGMSWNGARDACRREGGNLATISSQQDQNFAQSLLSDKGCPHGWCGYWMGFNDIGHEGNWVWVSGEPVTYRNWHGGEPNNQLKNGGDMGSGRENCGEVFEN